MLRATKDIMLPTTITGSLPRPSWYTRKSRRAQLPRRHGEQPVPRAICRHASRSICTSRNWPASTSSPTATRISIRDVGGQSWTNYPPRHMGGFDKDPQPTPAGQRRLWLSARPHPARLSGIARDAGHQRPGHARRPAIRRHVEGGAAHDQEAGQVRHHRAGAGRLRACRTSYYKSIKDRILAITDALNEELHELADAGCPVIQFEEPQIHCWRSARSSTT